MAKVQTKNKTQEQVMQGLTFPDLPYTDNSDTKPAPAANDPMVQIAALQGQIAAMQAQLSGYNQDRTAAIGVPAVTVAPTFDTTFKTDGLPDPTLDPEKYAAEVNARVAKVMDQKQAQKEYEQSQSASADARYNILWEQFSKQHPDYAGNPDRVEFVATKVIKQAAALGLDPNRYMASSKFFGDVVAQMDQTFGKPQAADEDEEVQQPQNVQYDAAGRTEAMFGGMVQGNMPIVSKDEAEGDMMAEVRAFQEKHGFHR